MTWRDDSDFARELTAGLERLAPRPRRDSVQRAMAAVERTEQHGGWRVLAARAGSAVDWPRLAKVGAVAAAALVVGIVIGTSGLLPRGGDATPTPNPSASQVPGDWQEPSAYSFVMVSSCGERSLLGRFGVTVEDGVTVAYEALDEQAGLYAGPPDEIPSLGEMLRLVAEARDGGAADVTLVTDPADGHPVEVDIDWLPNAIDDEECYAISEYVVRDQPSETPVPTEPTAMSFAVWERLEMPDPAPGVFGGGKPSSVVAFNGGYLAVGTIFTECCAEADPAANVGVVWTSTDGRDWRVVDVGETFEHATLRQVVTNGERLIAAGTFAELVDGALSSPVGATWTSSDGVTWQRGDGEAPSMVAVTPSGLIGADATDAGVAYFSSPDGAAWTRHGAWPDMDEVSAVVPRGDGAMVVGMRPGAPLADGTPTATTVVWTTSDGADWTGGSTVENARLKSVTPFAGGFVAIGSRTEMLAEGREIAAISSVWTSPDGLSWQERETDIGHPSENALGVFAIGEALVTTVECCGGDMVLRPLAWVSEDGARWTAVPSQPAFEGIDVRIVSVVETPDGLLAVGSRWDPETNHPVPQAWLSSSVAMVWLEATSEPDAEIGTSYEFQFGHCGLQSPIDLDGSLWVMSGIDYVTPPVPLDMLVGTVRLTGPDSAVFEDSASNWAMGFARHDGPLPYPLCD
jgi:hypothetical protein